MAADGKLSAAILEQPLDAETIRVLIMDNGFKQIFHDTIELTANCDGEMIYEKRKMGIMKAVHLKKEIHLPLKQRIKSWKKAV